MNVFCSLLDQVSCLLNSISNFSKVRHLKKG